MGSRFDFLEEYDEKICADLRAAESANHIDIQNCAVKTRGVLEIILQALDRGRATRVPAGNLELAINRHFEAGCYRSNIKDTMHGLRKLTNKFVHPGKVGNPKLAELMLGWSKDIAEWYVSSSYAPARKPRRHDEDPRPGSEDNRSRNRSDTGSERNAWEEERETRSRPEPEKPPPYYTPPVNEVPFTLRRAAYVVGGFIVAAAFITAILSHSGGARVTPLPSPSPTYAYRPYVAPEPTPAPKDTPTRAPAQTIYVTPEPTPTYIPPPTPVIRISQPGETFTLEAGVTYSLEAPHGVIMIVANHGAFTYNVVGNPPSGCLPGLQLNRFGTRSMNIAACGNQGSAIFIQSIDGIGVPSATQQTPGAGGHYDPDYYKDQQMRAQQAPVAGGHYDPNYR